MPSPASGEAAAPRGRKGHENGTLRGFFQFPEAPMRFSIAFAPRSGRALALFTCFRARRGRSQQGAAHLFPVRRDGLRSGSRQRPLFGDRQRGDLRAPAHLRLPRASRQAGADARRSDARGERRGQDVHLPDPQGRLFRRRPGVQGPQARADRPGLRLQLQALLRPGQPLAVCVHARRHRRASRNRASARRRAASSTTGAHPGPRGGRPLHAAHPAQRRPITTFRTTSRTPRFGAWRAK